MAQILVVDDEVGIRELLSEILEDEGHQVALAESAADARRVRERARPDLVLLDIWMPDTDGITLLKEWAASGQLTMAAGGVLFLTDLSRLERAEQRHLEFLLPRADKYKARIVSFSPVDPRSLVEKHAFDPDLCVRLAELTLKLPAVREFAEDVPDLASLMLAQLVEARLCPPRRLAIAALNALRYYPWPGNLAELESVMKDLAFTTLEEEIQLHDVERVLGARGSPGALPEIALDRPYREAREAFERVYFENLLAREHGSMSRVAERSGLERTHLYRKLKALGLPVGRREE